MGRLSIYARAMKGAAKGGMTKSPRFSGMSRLQEHAANNLGVIYGGGGRANSMFRDDDLDILDAYYENRAYNHLPPWDVACEMGKDSYVPVRKRAPRISYNLAKSLVDKVAAKLVGSKVFPSFVIEDDPDDTAFFKTVAKAASLRKKLMEPVKYTLTAGSAFVRYFLVNGSVQIESYRSKYCYPVFDQLGELESIKIKYVYEDPTEKDAQGNFKLKWYCLELSKESDILYDNPQYIETVTEPQFTVVEQNDHGLGWVQGEWLRTSEDKFDFDGYSLIGDVLDFFDELNYSLSQSSQAVSYNQDPQLTFKNIDEDELENLIKSSTKGWDLGKEGEAEFLESDLGGVAQAEETRDHMRGYMLDVVRVVLHDPEKMQAAAQSGRALEILNAPLVELVDELRTMFEPSFRNLLIKIGMTMLRVMAEGAETVLEVPEGYLPASFDINVTWPPLYPLTLDDIVKKATAASQLAQQHIVSHETLTRWIGADVGVENIDEELSKIEDEGVNQPWLNPFGMMGGDTGGGF